MYQPPVFREDRVEVMHQLMRAHPFAMLVSLDNGDICVDHLPLVLHEDVSPNGVIRGHIARGNPLAKNGGKAVAVFQGPQAYVSPSYYPSKQEHGKVVPTWNYAVVHARGQLSIIDDADWLMAQLTELTLQHEGPREETWKVSDAPESYIKNRMRGLVGIEFEIQRLEGKWKVSQNKDDADRAGVAEGLRLEGSAEALVVAALVEER